MFGKTLQKSVKELTAAGLAFAVLLLAYAQLGFLVCTCRHPAPHLAERLGGLPRAEVPLVPPQATTMSRAQQLL